jgi:hypothetical protein
MKYWVGVILVAVILVSGCAPKQTGLAPDNSSNFGRYDSMISEQFKGWQQTLEIKNMAEWPEGQRKDFILKGVTDAAAWRLVNSKETIEVWARSFNTYEHFRATEDFITGPLAWKDPASLAFGDVAQVGILHKPDAPDVLFLYASQNNTMFYINYMNDGAHYNATDLSKDKKFLVDTGRKLVGKAAEANVGFEY